MYKSKYTNLYRQRRLNQRNAEPSETLGWRTTSLSKPLAIDELNAAIRDGALHIKCEYTVAELKTFVRADNGSTHGSPHDDRVMSLAIANQMLKFVFLSEYRPKIEKAFGTIDWFASTIKPKEPEKFIIGSHNTY